MPVTGLKILVVEDHQDTARMMGRILSRDGHTIEIATTLSEASSKCATGSYDLIISDIELPDGMAFDLIQDGKACHGVKAIVVSGHGMAEHVRRSREAGYREHLIKPFSIDDLRAAVQRVIA